jgi:hypothetical protein
MAAFEIENSGLETQPGVGEIYNIAAEIKLMKKSTGDRAALSLNRASCLAPEWHGNLMILTLKF